MSTSRTETLLRVKDIAIRFGGITALDSVSFEVEKGQIFGLIGPNGAGKTSLFNCLSRLYEPYKGTIEFDGHALLSLPIHRIAGIGIGRTFQNLALFKTLSTRKNIATGAHNRFSSGYVANFLRLPGVIRDEQIVNQDVEELLDLLDLQHVADSRVDALPFGLQKRVELARALASRPKLLLLDEPAAGLNREEIDVLRETILTLRNKLGLTVLLVEHHMNLVMSVTDQVVVLEQGRLIANGTPSELQQDPRVIRAYLGMTHD